MPLWFTSGEVKASDFRQFPLDPRVAEIRYPSPIPAQEQPPFVPGGRPRQGSRRQIGRQRHLQKFHRRLLRVLSGKAEIRIKITQLVCEEYALR